MPGRLTAGEWSADVVVRKPSLCAFLKICIYALTSYSMGPFPAV